MSPALSSTESRLVAVGSYTEPYAPIRAVGQGITLLAFDTAGGSLDIVDELAIGPNPAYLRWYSHNILHAVLEADDARAAIVTIGLNGPEPRLRVLDQMTVAGRIPCHLDIDPSGQWLATAFYGSGTISLHRLVDGRPQQAVAILQHSGWSIHPERQTKPHPHAVRFSPDGRWLLVPDLGTDEIVCYPFDAADGILGAPRRARMPAGSGPRLVLFSPDGRYLLLANELACTIASFRWHNGDLALASSGPTAAVRPNTAAALRWHPSGEWIGTTNRGANTVALFRFNASDGALSPVATVPSGGLKPRDFEFSPCGRWLISSNQDSDSLVVYGVDIAGDAVTPTSVAATVASPSCVRFQPWPGR